MSNIFLHLAFSYLRYGLLAARAEMLKVSGDAVNPCILSGYDGKYSFSFLYAKCYLVLSCTFAWCYFEGLSLASVEGKEF